MTSLTDAEIVELERLERRCESEGSRIARLEYMNALLHFGPAILAELRALRKVREAAEALREANEAIYKTNHASRLEAELKEIRTKLDLFAALDEARGEQ